MKRALNWWFFTLLTIFSFYRLSTLLFRSALLFLPRFKIVFAAAKALGLRKKSRLTLYMNLDLSASYLSAKLSEKEAQSLRLQDLLLEWNIRKWEKILVKQMGMRTPFRNPFSLFSVIKWWLITLKVAQWKSVME